MDEILHLQGLLKKKFQSNINYKEVCMTKEERLGEIRQIIESESARQNTDPDVIHAIREFQWLIAELESLRLKNEKLVKALEEAKFWMTVSYQEETYILVKQIVEVDEALAENRGDAE
jgi:hypothetical protein